jgi:hypothetical protein
MRYTRAQSIISSIPVHSVTTFTIKPQSQSQHSTASSRTRHISYLPGAPVREVKIVCTSQVSERNICHHPRRVTDRMGTVVCCRTGRDSWRIYSILGARHLAPSPYLRKITNIRYRHSVITSKNIDIPLSPWRNQRSQPELTNLCSDGDSTQHAEVFITRVEMH